MPPNIIWKIWNSSSDYDSSNYSYESFTEWTPERLERNRKWEEEIRKLRQREETKEIKEFFQGVIYTFILLAVGTGIGLLLNWYFGWF